jgi:hypothetical protein
MCFLKAGLNFALPFLRIVTLGGKLLKGFMQPRMYFFETKTVWHLAYEDVAYSWY